MMWRSVGDAARLRIRPMIRHATVARTCPTPAEGGCATCRQNVSRRRDWPDPPCRRRRRPKRRRGRGPVPRRLRPTPAPPLPTASSAGGSKRRWTGGAGGSRGIVQPVPGTDLYTFHPTLDGYRAVAGNQFAAAAAGYWLAASEAGGGDRPAAAGADQAGPGHPRGREDRRHARANPAVGGNLLGLGRLARRSVLGHVRDAHARRPWARAARATAEDPGVGGRLADRSAASAGSGFTSCRSSAATRWASRTPGPRRRCRRPGWPCPTRRGRRPGARPR